MKTAIVFFATCGLATAGAAEGKTVFEAKCQPCHGPNGEGKPAIARMFKVEMHRLGSKEVQAKSDAELKKTITAGQGIMKPVAGLSDRQVDDVIAFVRTQSGTDPVRANLDGESQIRKEVERIESAADVSPLPAPLLSDRADSGSSVSRTVHNQTPNVLMILLAGPVDKRIVLPPGTKQTFEIPPGRYKVAARLLATDFPPLFAIQEYVSGHDYRSDFVVQ